MMSHNEAHLLTAVAYYVIGLVLLVTSLRLWLTHPINRAFLLGPYLTETGARLLMRHWWLVVAFGAFILSCALEHNADWALSRGIMPQVVTPALLEGLGWAETAISMGTAILVLYLRVRSWPKD